MSSIPPCSACGHMHIFIEEGNYCSDRMCTCSNYRSEQVSQLAQIQATIAGLETTYQKISHMLVNVPEFRELTNKEFVFTFWHFNNHYVVPPLYRNQLTDPETVRRAKQKVVEERPELGPREEGSLNLAKLAKEWGVREWAVTR